MKKFKYQARASDGQMTKGLVEAKNESQAISLLRQRQLTVISLRLQKESVSNLPLNFLQKTSFTDLVNFTSQLSTMIVAGLSLTEGLVLLEAQVKPAFSAVLAEIRRKIEGGSSLADAMAEQPQVFSKLYVASVRAGETAGVLDNVLSRLATNLEKQKEFRGKVKGAMIYPIIIIFGMVGVGAVMMIFVLPKMMGLYQEFGVTLPLMTRILMAVSNFVAGFWWLILLVLTGLFFFFSRWKKTKIGERQLARFIFKIPIVGSLNKKVILTEFTRTLGLLVETGIPIIEALAIVADATGNVIYQDEISQAAKKVEKGFPLATALAEGENFPPVVIQMINVGEETGKISEVLTKLSVYFETEAEQGIKGLTAAIEPLIIIILGIGVAFLVIAVIMPIYSLTSQF